MTKLVIQVPCLNESESISQTLRDLPKTIPGIDSIILLVVDDGSTDGTAELARKNGTDYVVRHLSRRGLSEAFLTGIQTGLALGADIIVNTDGDNQYPGRYIPDLVQPILRGEADLVIGDRQALKNEHFSPFKRWMEFLGSWVVRQVSNTDVPDAASGFRAYSRYAALRLQVFNAYSYTLESLIQAGRERMAIAHVPIETNPALRPSRLHRGVFNFLWNQGATIIRAYVLYQPLKTFTTLGIPFVIAGAYPILRFLVIYLLGEFGIGRYVQSLSIGGTSLLFGLLMIFLGLLGDASRANRKVLQETLAYLRDAAESKSVEPTRSILGTPIGHGYKHNHEEH